LAYVLNQAGIRTLVAAPSFMGLFVEATECLAEALDLNQAFGDAYHQIAIHLAYVQLLDIQRRHVEAIHHARKALDLAQHTPSQMYLADALTAISWVKLGWEAASRRCHRVNKHSRSIPKSVILKATHTPSMFSASFTTTWGLREGHSLLSAFH
jgi:hypothetical protein